MIGQRRPDVNGHASSASPVTRYTYDVMGRAVAPFDAQGHKIAEGDGNGALSTWAYDYFGLLLGRKDIGGATYSFTYDDARVHVCVRPRG